MTGVVGAEGKLHVRSIYVETVKKDKPTEGFRSKHFSLKEQSRLRPLKRETGWNEQESVVWPATVLITLYSSCH